MGIIQFIQLIVFLLLFIIATGIIDNINERIRVVPRPKTEATALSGRRIADSSSRSGRGRYFERR
jgi:hypothetical protein